MVPLIVEELPRGGRDPVSCIPEGIDLNRSRRRYKMKGQIGKPHSDRSSKDGTFWGRHEIIANCPACSLLTREEITITILGEPEACPKCGYIPRYDGYGQLFCNCTIWNEEAQKQRHTPDPTADKIMFQATRSQQYQNDLRRFFRKGRS